MKVEDGLFEGGLQPGDKLIRYVSFSKLVSLLMHSFRRFEPGVTIPGSEFSRSPRSTVVQAHSSGALTCRPP